MPQRLNGLLLISLLLTGCSGCASDLVTEQPRASTVQEPDQQEALLAFLQGQGGALAELTVADLGQLESVRLDQDYESADLALLAELPALREVMIWRDGDERPEFQLNPAPTDADLRILATLEQLETLRIGGWNAPYRDAGVGALTALPALKHLHLIQAQRISDDAMQSVALMPALESLNITYTRITDTGLAHLVGSTSLRRVRYGWAADATRSLEAFQVAHPEPGFILE